MQIGSVLNPLHSSNAHGLTFEALRRVNVARLPLFRDAEGNLAHSQPDGSDWSIAEWTNAIAGEVGEACNIAKKLKRGDFGRPGSASWAVGFAMLGKELSDVVIYSDLTAYQGRISLGDAVYQKFNEVSKRVGADIFLTDADHD